MYFFIFININPINLLNNDFKFRNESIDETSILDIPYSYYNDDDTKPQQNMNFSIVTTVQEAAVDATTTSANFSSMPTEYHVDKKFLHDLGNVSLAISKVSFILMRNHVCHYSIFISFFFRFFIMTAILQHHSKSC